MRTYKNLTNMHFGKLHVLRLDRKQGNKYYWLCSCECDSNKTKAIRSDRLQSGKVTSCGCDNKNKYTQNKEDFVGKRFGNLTVVEEIRKVYKNNAIRYFYKCQCDCGNTKTASRQNLQQGKVLMCDNCKFQNQYDLSSEQYGVGFSSNGGIFYFDKDDFDKIKKYRWYTTDAGYIRTHIDEKHSIFMHSLIYGDKDKMDIDHINRVKFDNRKENLREANRGENVINRDPISSNSSGVTGVYWNQNAQKWQATITKDGVNHYLGIYIDFNDAVNARKMAEVYYFGEYSYKYFENKSSDVDE